MTYPDRYTKAFEWLMGIEGMYSNHPADTGGETAWGISRNNWPKFWERGTPTREDARGFYYTEFWRRLRCDDLLSELVARELFEGAVLMGHRRAVMIAQESVNAIRFPGDTPLVVDGSIGPKTVQALNWWGQRYPEALYNTQNVLQGAFLLGLDRRDFTRGWMAKRIQAVQGEMVVTLPNERITTARVECADVMESLGFHDDAYLWNAFSYIWRHKGKNGNEDIRKAIWYLERMLPDDDSNGCH